MSASCHSLVCLVCPLDTDLIRSVQPADMSAKTALAAQSSRVPGCYCGVARALLTSASLSIRQQHPFFQMPCGVGVGRGMRIVRHHHDRFMEVFVQAL
jgi:hypothetical protein